jgi:hypothetical protein
LSKWKSKQVKHLGKSIFPLVAEYKGGNPDDDFIVRAKYIQVKQLSCKEHGIQFGGRQTCWKCGTPDLIKEDKRLICLYVNLMEVKLRVSEILTEKTTLNWKWNTTKSIYGRVVGSSLKAFGTDLTKMLNSFGEGFKVNPITEAELEQAFKREQNNKILREL